MSPDPRSDYSALRREFHRLQEEFLRLRGQYPVDMPAHARLHEELAACRAAIARWRTELHNR